MKNLVFRHLALIAAIDLKLFLLMLAAVAVSLSACGKPPVKTAADIATLISNGNCAEILTRVGDNPQTPEEKGAIAAINTDWKRIPEKGTTIRAARCVVHKSVLNPVSLK